MKKSLFIALMIAIFFSFSLVNGDVSDSLSLPSYDLEIEVPVNSKLKVGDQIGLKLNGLDFASGFQLENIPGSDPVSDQGWQLIVDSKIKAVPLRPGKLELPSLVIKNTEGRPIGRTNPFSVEVLSSIPSTDPSPQAPAPLKPPIGLPFPVWVLVVIGLAIFLLIALVIFGLLYLSRRKKLKEAAVFVAPPLPPRPEDVVALEELATLEKENLVLNGKYKAHFFGVSEILKTYLGLRYQFDAPESTAQEIIEVFERRSIVSYDLLRDLRRLFDDLDLIKFTDHSPSAEDGKKVLEGARGFILKTRRNGITEGQNVRINAL